MCIFQILCLHYCRLPMDLCMLLLNIIRSRFAFMCVCTTTIFGLFWPILDVRANSTR